MTITVKHKFVSAIPDSTDTTIVRPSNWNDDHTIVGLGTIASQDYTAVNITGGTISGTTFTSDTVSNYLAFTPTSAPSYAEGDVWYDSTQHTLAYYNDVTNNLVHVGQEVQVKVINNTGSTIAIGSPVYVTSTSSGQIYPNVALAKADAQATSAVLGLTTQAITNGSIGYVTTVGIIQPCNTGTFTVGDVLYLSPYSAGQLMNTVPPTGYAVRVGIVAYSNNPNGSIYVRQSNSYVTSGQIVGTITVPQGGTGLTSLTAGYIPYGNGTSAFGSSANMTFNGTTFTLANDATIHGLTVGLGGNSISTNTAFGLNSLALNTTGSNNSAYGYTALINNTTGSANSSFGNNSLYTNTTGSYNTAFGSSALNLNTTGNYNVAVGYAALVNNTVSNNTAVGYQAGYSNTSGADNTAVGYRTLYSNTTGSRNSAFGGQDAGTITPLLFNTTGTENTAVGNGSLGRNSTGSSNTGIGYTALNANTTGGSNTAVGWQSLYSNTTAGNNTAIGYQAGYSNTTGDGTVAVGSQALFANTTGVANVAVGINALKLNTTGSYNTTIGTSALFNNSTASYNTAVGNQAGYSNTTGTLTAVGTKTLFANTTGYLNVAIGGEVPGTIGAALVSNTTGAQNVAVGAGALVNNTTANNNLALGYCALYSNVTGSGNTAISNYALYNTTASNNTAIGYQAGYSVTGASNQLFGYRAGYGITSGANNVIIGAYEGSAAPISATGSNYIVLSDGAGAVRQVWNSSGAFGIAGATYGTSGQVLTSGGSSAVPTWTTPTTGTVTSITAGTGLSGGTITSSGTIAIDSTVATLSGTQTLTNKWVQQRVLASTANSATPTLNTDNYDMMVITGQSVAITSMTTNLTGTPVNGQKLWIAITGTGAIAITWGAKFESSTVTLPSTTVTTARLDVGFVWNVASSAWRCVAVA